MKPSTEARPDAQPWFSSDQRASCQDLWLVYDRHFETLNGATWRRAERHAQFGPLLRDPSPAQRESRLAGPRALLRAAMAGDAQACQESLREQGARCARLGVALSAWYDVADAFHADLVGRLVEAHGSEPARLSGALVALQTLLSRAMATIAEQYLETKQELIREAEARHSQVLESAEHSRLLWAHVFEFARFGIVISESETRTVRSVNGAYANMLGRAPEEIVGRKGTDFVAPESLAGLVNLIQTVKQRGHHVFEVTLLRKDGTRFPVLASSSVLPTRPGEPALRIATIVDISESKELERARVESAALLERHLRSEEASRLKSEFLANMSHELRTPLNSIIGFAELLHDGQVGPVELKQKEFLGDILASGQHLLQLINDVLDLSKVESGTLQFHPEPVDVGRLIGEVLSIMRTPVASKNLHLAASVAPGVRDIVIDPSRLKQVLYNYLSNALKFTAEGGRVDVRVLEEGAASFRIEVEDTGIGIAASDMHRLFVEFQQLDSSAAKQHGGTGLGLALTKRLVEAQGGQVGARSEAGRGSRFYAVLPRFAAGPARPIVARQGDLPPSPAGGPRILVVEDDPQDQATIASALIDACYTVEVASLGAQAIAKCQENDYAAVTLDLILPDMSGLEVLKAIRTCGRNAAVPIIVLTVVAESVTAGFVVHDVLAKPVDREALVRSLRGARGGGPEELAATLRACVDTGERGAARGR